MCKGRGGGISEFLGGRIPIRVFCILPASLTMRFAVLSKDCADMFLGGEGGVALE